MPQQQKRIWYIKHHYPVKPGCVELFCESDWMSYEEASEFLASLSPGDLLHRFMSSGTKTSIKAGFPTLTFLN